MPLHFALHSMGPVAGLAAGVALLWGLVRVALWDGSTQDRGVASPWRGRSVMARCSRRVRAAQCVDLWVPPLAVLAGCAGPATWTVQGPHGRLATWPLSRPAWSANGGYAAAGVRLTWEVDTVAAAGLWLSARLATRTRCWRTPAADVPDRPTHVQCGLLGGPPRAIYARRAPGAGIRCGRSGTVNTGGGVENAKWRAPGERLAERRRTGDREPTSGGRARRSLVRCRMCGSAYDRSLADGSAGYAKRAQLCPLPDLPIRGRCPCSRSEARQWPLLQRAEITII